MEIRQEKSLSSDFHMAMLRELERHHDEYSSDWSTRDPNEELAKALDQLGQLTDEVVRAELAGVTDPPDPKHLVHAANHLAICWAILQSRRAAD